MAITTPNPLISTQKSSDGLQVALHPLPLLSISDYMTRHTLRNEQGPIVGAMLGQQNGREITIEHTFEVLTIVIDGETRLSQDWFEERLQAMKDVHKAPALDLVGWYTLMPTSGPTLEHLPIHREILEKHNESAILVGLHPTEVLSGSVGGKLPITVYESNYEAEGASVQQGEDKEMKDGNEPQMSLKFKELPYIIETGEAEMISVDFVARGGGNATAVELKGGSPPPEDKKGKSRAVNKKEKKVEKETQLVLSREDEELIAALTAKVNAIKMMKSRIDLLIAYLSKLPPLGAESEVAEGRYTVPDQCILRSILALVQRINLLVPSNTRRFNEELLKEKNDVATIDLLRNLTTSVDQMRQVGRKHKIIDEAKHSKNSKNNGGGSIGGGGNWNMPLHSGSGISNIGDILC